MVGINYKAEAQRILNCIQPKEVRGYSRLLTLDQLEIGRSYELVVTTLSGLYRYKTKKTFIVVGRYLDTPTVIMDKG